VAAYVELHIEQGPRLEEAGIPIGVVESIVGVRRTRLIFNGQADHPAPPRWSAAGTVSWPARNTPPGRAT
jgi:hypothetical protein